MKLAIVGATGGIGRQLVDQAVAAGHDVTAVVRDPAGLAVPAVRADLSRATPADLAPAVTGADAVLSALGPRRAADVGVVTTGTGTILAAMLATGGRRLVVVSAAPVGTVPSPGRPHPPRHDPGDGPVMRHVLAPLTKAALRANYADLARMEDLLREADLDWTVVRPPRLTNRPLTGRYRTALDRNVRRGLTIPRADVAHRMLRALTEPDTIGHTIGIAT
jgi:putative NADH-flavin reductase